MIKLLVGLPGSGKTTYGRFLEKEGFVLVSQDDAIRIPKKTDLVEYMDRIIKRAVKIGKDVVVDGTFVSYGRRKHIYELAENLGTDVENCVFDSTADECISRKPKLEIAIRRLERAFDMPEEYTLIGSDWFSTEEAQKIIKDEPIYEEKLRKQIARKKHEILGKVRKARQAH